MMRQSRIFGAEHALSAKRGDPSQPTASHGLLVAAYHDFIDRYIVRNIREPLPPCPANLFDDNMQRAFTTGF